MEWFDWYVENQGADPEDELIKAAREFLESYVAENGEDDGTIEGVAEFVIWKTLSDKDT